ncbi:hypothetical protein KCP71_11870 [Salmonella enterica subsp. enterica]|nr:hypothetical protein KCP71_11870 [Salmonella enterica subsp. enterica]
MSLYRRIADAINVAGNGVQHRLQAVNAASLPEAITALRPCAALPRCRKPAHPAC